MDTKIVGVERSCFRPKGGDDEIKGYNLYLAAPISPDRGSGSRVERLYLSDNKAAAWGLNVPNLVDHTVQALYNRWGKLASLVMID